MSGPIITKVIEEMNKLPDDLQQQVLQFVTLFGSNTHKLLVMPGMCWNPSPEALKPLPISQPNTIITSTEHPKTRRLNHDG